MKVTINLFNMAKRNNSYLIFKNSSSNDVQLLYILFIICSIYFLYISFHKFIKIRETND
ncbi:hypothetical protein [Arcobacter aquimarinus]|uniref:hypothetical protein n=1 Tax=Arcobacter aquimarinus TaxID=1315211 RepID=UPI001C1E24E9|nr:hypothetical protein [Arcobacter aquimarinus]